MLVRDGYEDHVLRVHQHSRSGYETYVGYVAKSIYNRFEDGDEIECISEGHAGVDITVGKIYKVLFTSPFYDWVGIIDDSEYCTVYGSRLFNHKSDLCPYTKFICVNH